MTEHPPEPNRTRNGQPSPAHLEAKALELDPGSEARQEAIEKVAGYIQNYLDGLKAAPAYFDRADRGQAIRDAELSEEGIGLDAALELLGDHVDSVGINTTSGRFFGYVPGGGLFASALGDWLAAATNRYAGVFFASPGAVRIENQLIDWMAEMIGYPDSAGGYLAAGGSLANQTAIVTAREAADLYGDAIESAVVYLTEHAHHCIDKALHLSGLGRCAVRRIPVDKRYRMKPEALKDAIERDLAGGLSPWLVVASAGTTNTGSVDPLADIADIAEQHKLWYHIDAAYGGFFRLCPETRDLLAPMSRADSVVIDPHKTLFLPYGTGALLVRDSRRLREAHAADADYMQDTHGAMDEVSPANVSPELTKHFRGLRMWLPLQVHGTGAFRAALSEKLHLARYFHDQLRALDRFEVGPRPDLSIVTYRYRPHSGDTDDFNRRLARELQRDGRIFVSSTQIDGRFMLRLAAVCFRSHQNDVDEAVTVIREVAGTLDTRPVETD